MPSKRIRKKQKQKKAIKAAAATAAAAASGASALTTTQEEKIPKSVIVRRGKTALEIKHLVHDMRHLMLPYTALNYQEDANNRKMTLSILSQHLALPMGMTHILQFSQSRSSTTAGIDHLNLRLARTPAGPTLHFRIHQFSLVQHIQALQRRPIANTPTSAFFQHPPMVVTHNFGSSNSSSDKHQADVSPHIKLLRITFQNMFPAINVSTVKLSHCRRVVLFNLVEQDVPVPDSEENDNDDDDYVKNSNDPPDSGAASKNRKESTENQKTTLKKPKTRRCQMVEMRHYAIKATPVGAHRRVRRLAQQPHKLPNLHSCQDVADYIMGGGGSSASSVSSANNYNSDSEAEDDPAHVITLPDQFAGKGNIKSQKSALKLVEIGPRLSMELVKVERGLGAGDVLYHGHVHKTPEEAAALKLQHEQTVALKAQRRAIQEANVQRKRAAQLAAREERVQKKQKRLVANQTNQRNQEDEEDEIVLMSHPSASSGSDSSDDDE